MTYWKYGYSEYVYADEIIPALKLEGIKGIIIIVERDYGYFAYKIQHNIKEVLAKEGYQIKREHQGYILLENGIRIQIKPNSEKSVLGECSEQKLMVVREEKIAEVEPERMSQISRNRVAQQFLDGKYDF